MPNEVIARRYTLIRELGRGASATVFLAHDATLERDVALKLVAPALANDPGFVDRFMREARLSASLSHPNIVSVHDVGEAADGRPFIVMALVHGLNLESVIANSAPIPLSETARILSELANALDYLHGQGLIHRDVKPSNILIEESGRVLLSDFGVAYAREAARYTMTGVALGTPRYMAPEQMLGEEPTPQTDVYAMGVLAFEMLAGAPPFEGAGTGLMYKIVHEPPPPVTRLAPSVPPGVEAAIARALEKDPAARWDSPGEFAAALASSEANATALGVFARPASAPPVAPVPHQEGSPNEPEATSEPGQEAAQPSGGGGSRFPKKKAMFGAGAAAVLALAVGSFCLAAGRPASPEGGEDREATPTATLSTAAASSSPPGGAVVSPTPSATTTASATAPSLTPLATSSGGGGGQPSPTSPPAATATSSPIPTGTAPATATLSPTASPTPTPTATSTPTATPTMAPPSAPSNVTLNGNTLSWNDNSNNELGFRIYWRSTTVGSGETTVTNDKSVGGNVTTTTVSTIFLTADQTGFRRGVSAYNGAGESAIAWGP